MIRIPGKIPIAIHPLFWLLAFLIGFLYAGFNMLVLLWVVIVFISVLFHELGHAITALHYGKHPKITLVALGGVTTYDGSSLKLYQQFIVIFNGPFFGLILAGMSYGIYATGFFQNEVITYFLRVMFIINIFWSCANLLPIFPLDGGQLMRVVFEGMFKTKGIKIALFLSTVFALTLSLICFFLIKGAFIIGALFFLFAFQSFEMWRKSRLLSDNDHLSENKQQILEAEQALQQGDKEKAKKIFQEIRDHVKQGLLFVTATQYLAFIDFEQGDKKNAYDLLLSIERDLADDAIFLLHELAFEFKNFELVAKLSSKCYQTFPSQKVALLNSQAFAGLKQPKPAGGWLATALAHGKVDLKKLLEETEYKNVNADPIFKKFIQKNLDE